MLVFWWQRIELAQLLLQNSLLGLDQRGKQDIAIFMQTDVSVCVWIRVSVVRGALLVTIRRLLL